MPRYSHHLNTQFSETHVPLMMWYSVLSTHLGKGRFNCKLIMSTYFVVSEFYQISIITHRLPSTLTPYLHFITYINII